MLDFASVNIVDLLQREHPEFQLEQEWCMEKVALSVQTRNISEMAGKNRAKVTIRCLYLYSHA